MVAALFLTSLRDNGRLAARFCSAPVLRLPVLLLWVAVFGGSLHAPCTTFFYLSVGASQEQVGNISAIISVVSMLTVPLYGHFIDATAGALEAVAAAGFCCALGCAVRAAALSVAWLYAGSLVLGFGAASLLPSVLSHLSSHCAPDEKRKVVAAVAFQTSLLRLDGQSRRCKMLNQYFDRCSLSRLCHDPECTRGTCVSRRAPADRDVARCWPRRLARASTRPPSRSSPPPVPLSSCSTG